MVQAAALTAVQAAAREEEASAVVVRVAVAQAVDAWDSSVGEARAAVVDPLRSDRRLTRIARGSPFQPWHEEAAPLD